MLFTQTHFLFYFLPLALALHRFTTRRIALGYRTASCLVLFGATLIFYGYGAPWFLLPFFIGILFDYGWAQALQRVSEPRARRILCGLSVVQNLGLLGYFKYSVFLTDVWFSFTGISWGHWAYRGALPPGISFYTFESLSFVIDVYRRQVTPPNRPWPFLGFIGMFPRLVAGPIVRYSEMARQFTTYSGMQWGPGIFLFSIGLFSKGCLADSFALFVPYAFSPGGPYGLVAAWLGVFAYTFQIYFDFSGYSLMAIGLGRCLGFQFPTNFNRPYHAASLQEFWRRWHMTLSQWLRDYLYIPLGGSRHGEFATVRNLFLTMVLGGLWHGAGATFLLWGAVHGGLLIIERALSGRISLPILFRRIATFSCVAGAWVLFRAADIHEAGRIYRQLFRWDGGLASLNPTALQVYPVAIAFAGLGLVYWLFWEPRIDFSRLEKIPQISRPQEIFTLALLAVALVTVLSSYSIPFLYFQF